MAVPLTPDQIIKGSEAPDLEDLDEPFRCPSIPCAVNVPRGSQSREFFEVFEAPSEPSVRAFVVGK